MVVEEEVLELDELEDDGDKEVEYGGGPAALLLVDSDEEEAELEEALVDVAVDELMVDGELLDGDDTELVLDAVELLNVLESDEEVVVAAKLLEVGITDVALDTVVLLTVDEVSDTVEDVLLGLYAATR